MLHGFPKSLLTYADSQTFNAFFLFNAGYLIMLSVPRLYSVRYSSINEYGAIGGIKITRGSQSDLRKPAPVPLYPHLMVASLRSNTV
jgi:hypothetical protein